MSMTRIGLLLLIVTSAAQAQEPFNLVNPLPPQGPVFPDGYQIRWPVRTIGDVPKLTAQTVLVSLPTGGWLKPDASDLVVMTAEGKPQPHIVLSHDPAGETIIQFKRNGNDPWYWVFGLNPKAPPRPNPATPEPAFHEGLTLEVRDWAGDDISSWAKVRPGLDKSPRVIANAIVGDVIQSCNPARPDQPHKFAASYRGYLDIKKPGTYRFLINADDASFLFVDGFKVFERAGSNARLGQVKLSELDKMSGKVDLKEGVHAFEVHHVVGTNPEARGVCALFWAPPGQDKFTHFLNKELRQPIYARTAGIQRNGEQSAAAFAFGIDDVLETTGLKLYLVRFEAQGEIKEGEKLSWDFGDGTTGTGRSVRHVYFQEGDYTVTLTSGAGLPAFRRTVHVWPEPNGETSPLSLDLAVKTLEATDWKKLDIARIRELFAFLSVCEQPDRWKLLEQVSSHLLEQKGENLDFRSQLWTARLEALAHLGKAGEALKLAETVTPEFAKVPALHVRIQMAVASIYQDHLKDGKQASKIYKTVLDEHRRTEHPFLRLAAIRWGDLYAEAGDLARAGEAYRLAATLGGEKFLATVSTEATTRGAMLRVAEQKLRSGDIQHTRQLLERIELEFPGQRIDGLYSYLRGEADRYAGRYEDALRSYEMLLNRQQGYQDRAFLGIADCYFRNGELEKARKWMDDLKERHPKFYEAQKAADFDKLIDIRLDRLKAARSQGNPIDAFFKGWSTGFEPEETESFGTPAGFPVVAAPGTQGPHVAMIDVFPTAVNLLNYQRVGLKNLTPGGMYWIEIWHKDIIRPIPPDFPTQRAFLHVYLSPENSKAPEILASCYLERNTHQWHKLGLKIKAPLAQDFSLKIMFYNQSGIILYDSLSVLPVSDRQVDSLLSFHRGPKAE